MDLNNSLSVCPDKSGKRYPQYVEKRILESFIDVVQKSGYEVDKIG